MRLFQLFIIIGIVLLYLFKQILLLEFSFDAYRYVIILLSLLALISAFQFKGGVPIAVILYFLIFHLSVLVFFFNGGTIGPGYYEGYFLYFLQPFILWLLVSSGSCVIKTNVIVSIVAHTVWVSIIGVILYYINIYYPLGFGEELFQLEFTSIGSTIVIRNTSIYGNSLVAAGIGLVQMCSATLLFAYGKKKYIYMVFISFLFIATTLSRRSMVSGALLFLIIYIIVPRKTKNRMLALSVATGFIAMVFFMEYAIVFIDRFLSSIDFSKSDNNLSRLMAMLRGLGVIFTYPTGTGIGSLSSLGKEYETINQSENFLGVTESMYITFIGEIGIVFVLPILILFYVSIYNKNPVVKWLLVFPFIVESIMGLALLNPAVNFLFFLLYFSYRKSLKNYEKQYV